MSFLFQRRFYPRWMSLSSFLNTKSQVIDLNGILRYVLFLSPFIFYFSLPIFYHSLLFCSIYKYDFAIHINQILISTISNKLNVMPINSQMKIYLIYLINSRTRQFQRMYVKHINTSVWKILS